MHLYVLARGNLDALNRWINDMLARYYPMEYEKGKIGQLQLSVRPVQILELVFPEKQMEKVLRDVWPYDHVRSNNKVERRIVKYVRKLLGLQAVPYFDPASPIMSTYIFNRQVGVTAIGLKKDKFKDGIEDI